MAMEAVNCNRLSSNAENVKGKTQPFAIFNEKSDIRCCWVRIIYAHVNISWAWVRDSSLRNHFWPIQSKLKFGG